jgi:hypothetical protein
MESILDSIKKLHGISPSDVSFDPDIIIHINSALLKLTQMGVGPLTGFFIKDNTTKWSDFIPDEVIAESVKSFVYVKVRLVFDPPASPTVVSALESSADESAWYIVQWVESNS